MKQKRLFSLFLVVVLCLCYSNVFASEYGDNVTYSGATASLIGELDSSTSFHASTMWLKSGGSVQTYAATYIIQPGTASTIVMAEDAITGIERDGFCEIDQTHSDFYGIGQYQIVKVKFIHYLYYGSEGKSYIRELVL